LPLFFSPIATAGEQLQAIFVHYEGSDALQPQVIPVAGRPLSARAGGASENGK